MNHYHAGDYLNSVLAVVYLGSPFWIPWLKAISEMSAICLPILGVVLVLVQIIYYARKTRR